MSGERTPWLRRDLRSPRMVRGRLRIRVLGAVTMVTLVTLVGFDFAAVTALHSYLIGQVDSRLNRTIRLYQSLIAELPPAVRQAINTSHHVASPLFAGDQSPGAKAMAAQTPVLRGADIAGPDIAAYGRDLDNMVQMGYNVPSGSPAGTQYPRDLHVLPVDGGPRTVLPLEGPGRLRAIVARAPDGIVEVSTPLDDVEDTTDRMRLIVIVGSAAAVLLIGLGVFWLLRRGMRPIETMAAQADRITAGNLTDRVTEQDPHSEVGRLGSALNGMLARIEAGQENMRRFIADASHELRTPLASLRANAELHQQGAVPDQEETDEVMRRIALEAQRMSGLVDDMLRLARLDQHPDHQREPVDLSDLVASCVERIRVPAPHRAWHTDIASGVHTIGDEELLRRAVDNLLANVITHTPEDTTVTVSLSERHGTIEIEVADTGPGVPTDRLPFIFDRFYRGDTTTKRWGSGLGLAIVAEIASIHNGTVTAEPNQPNGLTVRFALTADGPPDHPDQ